MNSNGGVLNNILSQQILAALIHSPATPTAKAALADLEPEDFDTWIHQTIYSEGLLKCDLPDHPEPGSVITQINRRLLASGHYQDTDNGLRQAVADLTSIVGHPEQLHYFVADLLEQRFRRAVGDFALAAVQHAQDSPLADVDAALARITELRRLRGRLNMHEMLSIVKPEVA